jgi:hypothetical protein
MLNFSRAARRVLNSPAVDRLGARSHTLANYDSRALSICFEEPEEKHEILGKALLVSQSVIPRRGKLGGAVPMAFTEQGVAMLSSVLRSRRAVQVNIAIMRAFVRLREMLLTNAELARELADLEKRYDAQFKVVFDAIRQLMSPPEALEKPKRRIGFHTREDE